VINMAKYHYDSDNDSLEETRRLDDINQEVKKMVADKTANTQEVIQTLGDSNSFLDNFESEKFDSLDENEEDDDESDSKESFHKKQMWGGNEIKEAQQQHRFKILVTVASILCILMFIGAFALVRGGIFKSTEDPEEAVQEMQGHLLLVKEITDKAEFFIYDTADGTDYTIQTDEETVFLDRNGGETTIKGFSEGDLISVILQEGTRKAEKVFFSEDTWIKENISGLKVDTASRTMELVDQEGQVLEKFKYYEDTLFSYQDKDISPQNIAEMDIVQMQGNNTRVWSIQVLEYHGYITIKNTDKVQNGEMKLDDEEPIALTDMERFPVAEGAHKVTITGSNIETRTDEVYVFPEEETVLDMSVAQSKTGVLILSCKVADFKLYVNGQEKDGTKPIVLTQGTEYDIVILAKGYKQWNQKITLQEASLTINVELEEDITKGTIHFYSVPSGATIYLNSENIGITPIQKQLPYGTYTVMVELEGYHIYSETITVNKPSETITYRLESLDTEE
jgi:hypothetical protein